MKLIQPGNSKLKSMLMFNLPATKQVCNRICAGCYAAREQVRFPSTLAVRNSRYQAAQSPDFASRMISELSSKRKLPTHFRIHASGEFFSQAYVDSWVLITQAFPTITFYAYTKRLRDFNFSNLQSLPNFVLINSLHFGTLNYGTTPPPSAFVCPSATATCGQSCIFCMTKGQADTHGVYFLKH